MKDLYTFDYDTSLALATYNMVRKAYVALFNELKIQYTVAEADSGNMGGNLSHEFHFPTPKGEDHVISCSNCNYAANEELAYSSLPMVNPQGESAWTFIAPDQIPTNPSLERSFSVWRGLSRDRKTLINVWYALTSPNTSQIPTDSVQPEINTHAVKAVMPELDPGVEDVYSTWAHSISSTGRKGSGLVVIPNIVNLVDHRLPASVTNAISSKDGSVPVEPKAANQPTINITSSVLVTNPLSNEPLNLIRIRNGDACSRCDGGKLRVERTIELGHTFFLGSRYSEPLNALVSLPTLETRLRNNGQVASSRKPVALGNRRGTRVPMQMGCYGIGVSRMIGAVAEILSDDRGLNWPRAIAPYELVVIPIHEDELDAVLVYDTLSLTPQGSERIGHRELDVTLDDRELPFAWKIRDADLIGYPVVVVVGKRWKVDKTCEVQCRRLGVREDVSLEDLTNFVHSLLTRL
jgi:prolyl-tRNA synthetase